MTSKALPWCGPPTRLDTHPIGDDSTLVVTKLHSQPTLFRITSNLSSLTSAYPSHSHSDSIRPSLIYSMVVHTNAHTLTQISSPTFSFLRSVLLTNLSCCIYVTNVLVLSVV